MIDPRGIPTATCPNCGCNLIWIVATFDGTVVTFTVPPLTGNKILVYGEKGTN